MRIEKKHLNKKRNLIKTGDKLKSNQVIQD